MIDRISLSQAVVELNLEIILTLVLSLSFFFSGWILGGFSLKQQIKLARYNEQNGIQKLWWSTFWQGISTELVGAAITAIVFGIFLLMGQQYQAIQNQKADLILQMGSPNQAFAIEAVRIANQKGWLHDGTLQHSNLLNANLSEIDLNRAFLQEATLIGADLSNSTLDFASLALADLSGATLRGASLERASLFDAILSQANLSEVNAQFTTFQWADLSYATLQEINLFDANLIGANLTHSKLIGANIRFADLSNSDFSSANLVGADLSGAILDQVNFQSVILPDGTRWTSETDLSVFTNPQHPDYDLTRIKINALRLEQGITPLR